MAEGIPFRESNGEMGIGDNDPNQVLALPVHFAKCPPAEQEEVVSCWRLTIPELEEINRTGVVWLRVMGCQMPPVLITGFKPFEKVE